MTLRLTGILLAAVGVQLAGVALLRPPGERLRPIVDLLSVEGLLLALVGAFLVADRPFLAARAFLRSGRGEPEGEERQRRRRRERSLGAAAIVAGAGLFGGSALLWAWLN